MSDSSPVDVEALDADTALILCYGKEPADAVAMAEATMFRDAQGRDAFSFQVPLPMLERLVAAYVHRFGPILCPACRDYEHPGQPCATPDPEEAEPLAPEEASAALADHFGDCTVCRGRAGVPGVPCGVALMLRGQLHA